MGAALLRPGCAELGGLIVNMRPSTPHPRPEAQCPQFDDYDIFFVYWGVKGTLLMIGGNPLAGEGRYQRFCLSHLFHLPVPWKV
jgi:hypothetical protein